MTAPVSSMSSLFSFTRSPAALLKVPSPLSRTVRRSIARTETFLEELGALVEDRDDSLIIEEGQEVPLRSSLYVDASTTQ
jgi:hypothetical protein